MLDGYTYIMDNSNNKLTVQGIEGIDYYYQDPGNSFPTAIYSGIQRKGLRSLISKYAGENTEGF
jgi:hypothetical protein